MKMKPKQNFNIAVTELARRDDLEVTLTGYGEEENNILQCKRIARDICEC